MYKSILAGFLIGMGCVINIILGGLPGAFMFSLGLITILTFNLNLFTGRAGDLIVGKISLSDLFSIWFGNFCGALVCAALVGLTPLNALIAEGSTSIVELRGSQAAITNTIYGIFCGMLMYIAVTGFRKTDNYLFAIAPVAFFILCGFNHCVADMFYISASNPEMKDYLLLLPTTFGNILGANVIPTILVQEK